MPDASYIYLSDAHSGVSAAGGLLRRVAESISLTPAHSLSLSLSLSLPPPHTHADSYSLSHPLTHPVSHPQVECYEEWLTAASRLVPLWDMDTIRQVLSFGNVILYNVLIKWFL